MELNDAGVTYMTIRTYDENDETNKGCFYLASFDGDGVDLGNDLLKCANTSTQASGRI